MERSRGDGRAAVLPGAVVARGGGESGATVPEGAAEAGRPYRRATDRPPRRRVGQRQIHRPRGSRPAIGSARRTGGRRVEQGPPEQAVGRGPPPGRATAGATGRPAGRRRGCASRVRRKRGSKWRRGDWRGVESAG